MPRQTPTASPALALLDIAKRRKPLFQSAKHAISFFARSAARNAVKQKLRDDGARLSLVPVRVICELAERYLAEHPELYTLALQRARRLGFVETLPIMVTRDPTC